MTRAEVLALFEHAKIAACRKVGKLWFVAWTYEGETALSVVKDGIEYDECDPDLPPEFARAPQSVLDCLSGTTDQQAKAFRADCQAWADRPVGLRVGDKIRYRNRTWTKTGVGENRFISQHGYERLIPPHELLKARRCRT